MRGSRCFWVSVVAVFALISVRTVGAQVQPGQRELVGTVRDPLGAVLEGVTVEIPGQSTRTNTRGAFQLFTAALDTVTITIRVIGYTELSALLTARESQWDTVLVQLERTAQALKGVTVKENANRRGNAFAEFDERRARGNGVFVTRADIVTRGATRLGDLVRSMRGVNVVRGRVRFVSQTGSRGTLCQPDVWLDGTRARGMEVDDILASDVEAMELYANFSSVPFEFSSRGANSIPCGTIVIWTRAPGGKSP